MNRRLLSLAATVAVAAASASAVAQSPSLVPVQGQLTDSMGVPVDGTLPVAFRLYTASTGGSLVFSEGQTLTFTDGRFTALLGETAPLDLAIFRDETVYLGVVVAGSELTPRIPVGTSPYAGYARWSESAAMAMSVDWSAIANVPAGLSDGDDVGAAYSAALPVVIAGNTISLSSDSCAAGALWTWTGATWTCAVPVTPSYTAGDGLTLLSGQFAVNSTIQRRVSWSCDPSEYIYQINPDGTVLCETDDVDSDGDITAVTTAPDSGLVGGAASGPIALSVNKAQIQARITQTCGPNRAMRAVNEDGTIDCIDLVPSSAILPPGMVIAYGGVSVPSGWLEANGAAVSRSTYADLFAVLGTTYGAGDGSTTFNVPDLRGRTAVGAGTGPGLTDRVLGTGYGSETVTLSQGNLPNVTLSGTTNAAGNHTHSAWTDTQGSHNHTGTTSTDGSHNHDSLTPWQGEGNVEGQGWPAWRNYSFRSSDRGRDWWMENGSILNAGAHAHSFATSWDGAHGHNVGIGGAGDHSHTVSVPLGGSGLPVPNVQPSLAVRFLIKH